MKDDIPRIEINPEFRRALDIMENTERSVFITGRAGTGKSTLLSHFCDTTKKKAVVLAPTGVAALNVKGKTIHSFFRFKPNVTLEAVKRLRYRNEKDNIYKKLDTIIIDEISMVRADLLDCVDKFLRLNGPKATEPFGGMQMVFIGDLYQLPPVVSSTERDVFKSMYASPYFYSSKVFESFDMEFIELEKVYRQSDAGFINLLNSIRNKTIGEEGLGEMNKRWLPAFEPRPGERYIYLTTTNALADQINTDRLARLKGKAHTFMAEIEGDFGKEYLPTAIELNVKPGAQIMMLNNDSFGRWVNGSIGEILHIRLDDDGEPVIIVDLADGEEVTVAPFTWEIYDYYVRGGQLQSEVIGKFTQFPLMLAWAVTIHKSQGKTFDKVVIDFGRGTFAHGQAYVALSRCTSLDGIVLKRPLRRADVLTDYNVIRFLTKYQYKKSEEAVPLDDKVVMIKNAIENRTALEIVYLKPNDEKSKRLIIPLELGEMQYGGKTFLGVSAFCLTRQENRHFRVDRILQIKDVGEIEYTE